MNEKGTAQQAIAEPHLHYGSHSFPAILIAMVKEPWTWINKWLHFLYTHLRFSDCIEPISVFPAIRRTCRIFGSTVLPFNATVSKGWISHLDIIWNAKKTQNLRWTCWCSLFYLSLSDDAATWCTAPNKFWLLWCSRLLASVPKRSTNTGWITYSIFF